MKKDRLDQIDEALLILAEAIEDGRISGIKVDVLQALGISYEDHMHNNI